MSDATNDTTRTSDYDHCGMCGAKRCCGTPSYWPAHDCGERIAQLEADLLRLAGPVCAHPPCKGRRACEHTELLCRFGDSQSGHPEWPRGAEWHRTRV